jgi:ubiquinone/menaquinone biosynthesis C-methylase UbiE
MIDLEIRTIGQHIKEGDNVIDIGCANGYSTYRQFDENNPASIVGIDFAKSMIDAANEVRRGRNGQEKVSFRVGDVRCLDYEKEVFDVAYTTRVLINLPTWEDQKIGIDECLRVVRPGGRVIISEGFWEPLCRLNAIRLLSDLPPLVEHDFNRYLKMSVVEDYLRDQGIDYKINDFSSIYYLGSRFLRELVTDPARYDGFSNPINKIFYEIEQQFSGGGFGIQQAIVLAK